MSIKIKTLLLGLIIPLLALAILTAVSGRYFREVAVDAFRTTFEVGRSAAVTSEVALEQYSSYLLKNVVEYRAQCGDERLARITDNLQLIAHIVSNNLFDTTAPPLAPDTGSNSTPEIWEIVPADAKNNEISPLPARFDPLLQHLAQQIPHSNVYLGTTAGELRGVFSDDTASRALLKDWQNGEWYRAACSEKQTGWTRVYPNALTGTPTLSCYAPIFSPTTDHDNDHSDLAAVVGIDLPVADVAADLLDIPFGEHSLLVVLSLDDDRVLFAVSNQQNTTPQRVDTASDEDFSTALTEVRENLRAGQSGIRETVFADEKFVVAFAPLRRPRWGLCMLTPESVLLATPRLLAQKLQVNGELANHAIYRRLSTDLRHYFFTIVLVLVTMAILSLLLTRRIDKGLRILSTGAARIGRGQFTEKIKLSGSDELTTLASDLNAMAEQLDIYTTRLSQTERLAGEMRAAREIQTEMLPIELPQRDEFSLAAMMEPAREVGGDFYDYFPLADQQICLVIGDIAGKGVPAALLMAISKTLLKKLGLQFSGDLPRVFGELNHFFATENRSGYFLTLLAAIINYQTGETSLVNAGHPPLLLHAAAAGNFQMATRERLNPAIGIRHDAVFTAETLKLQPDDRLFFYTDGVTEAENRERKLFGETALLALLNQYRELPPKKLIAKIHAELRSYANGQPLVDDLTMLAFSYFGAKKND